jgi:hypothetical protein
VPDPDGLLAETTLAPKNLRISASASRCESDTASNDASEEDVVDDEDVACCSSGYLEYKLNRLRRIVRIERT